MSRDISGNSQGPQPPAGALSGLFSKLSARKTESDVIPAEKEILQAKINIVSMSKNPGGYGAQG